MLVIPLQFPANETAIEAHAKDVKHFHLKGVLLLKTQKLEAQKGLNSNNYQQLKQQLHHMIKTSNSSNRTE